MGSLLLPALRLTTLASRGVNRAAAWMVTGLSLSMALVILLQVFFRYALNNSLFWSEELGRMLLVWLTFIGASVAYERGAHVGVGVLVARLPAPARRLAAVLVHCASLVLFWVMLWYGWHFFLMLAPQSTVSLGFSRQWPFLAVPLSGGIMLLHGVRFLLQDVCGIVPENAVGEEP